MDTFNRRERFLLQIRCRWQNDRSAANYWLGWRWHDPNLLLEITQPQVEMADRHAEQRQAKSVLGKGRKAEIDPVAFGDPGHRKVRRGPIRVPLLPRQAPIDNR